MMKRFLAIVACVACSVVIIRCGGGSTPNGPTGPSPGSPPGSTPPGGNPPPPGAGPYFEYFGAAAGPSGAGYYSFQLGDWHAVALNSNVGVHEGSAQAQWLRADLAANRSPCAIAYWHHPLFTSGPNGNSTHM